MQIAIEIKQTTHNNITLNSHRRQVSNLTRIKIHQITISIRSHVQKLTRIHHSHNLFPIHPSNITTTNNKQAATTSASQPAIQPTTSF